jgi:NitT/TauT family transport system permease protein
MNAKFAIVVAVAFFPMMLNTLAGLRVRKRDELDLMSSLGATRYQVYRFIRLPNALPFVFAGLHLGAIYSLLGAVTAEFLGSSSGLGYIMLQQRAMFNTPAVFAILLLLMIIGTTLHLVMQFIEHRVLFWSRDATETSV